MSIPGVGDFIAIVKLAKQVKENFTEAPKQYKVIQNELKQIPPLLERLKRHAKDHDADVTEPLRNCQAVLEDIDESFKKIRDGGRGRIVWERLKWDAKGVDRLRDRLVSCVLVLSTITTSLSQDDTAKLVDAEKARKLEEFADCLAPAVYLSDHAAASSLRLAGTGQWLLEHSDFDRRMRSATSEVLLLHGIPGSGKTILASTIIDHLRQTSDSVVCFYYCKYTRSPEDQTAMKIMRSIIRQLMLGSRDTSDVETLVDQERKGCIATSDEVLTVLNSIITRFKRIYIIVDALDEATSQGQHLILIQQLLRLSNETQTHIKLVFTSRLIPDVEKQLARYKSIEIMASLDDLESFVDSELQPNNQPLYRMVSKQPSLRASIKRAIVQAVSGSFMLAKLHMQSLQDQATIGGLKRALQALESGTISHEQAYRSTLERINSQRQIGELAISALIWITFAKRLLTVGELLHALGTRGDARDFDDDDIPAMDDIVSACCGLVSIDQVTGIVGLVHLSAQEYIVLHGSEWLKDPHRYISDICRTYLAFEDLAISQEVSQERIVYLQNKYQLWDYASRHILEHAALCNDVNFDRIMDSQRSSEASGKALMDLSIPGYLYLCRENPGLTGLHLLAYCGRTDDMLKLLEKYDINAKDHSGMTPIQCAIRGSKLESVQLLIDRGARLDCLYSNGKTLLLELLSNLSERPDEAITRLLASSCEVEQLDQADSTGRSPLLYAIRWKQTSVVEALLKNGASYELAGEVLRLYIINPPTGESGYRKNQFLVWNGIQASTLLMLAQLGCSCSLEMALLLISQEKDINARDAKGNTEMHYAVKLLSIEMVQALLDSGADLDLVNQKGLGPLSYMLWDLEPDWYLGPWCRLGRAVAMIQFFLDRGIDPKTLESAIFAGMLKDVHFHFQSDYEDVSLLIQICIQFLSKIPIRRRFDELSVWLQARCHRMILCDKTGSLLLALLATGMPVDHSDREGMTCLMYAAKDGCPVVVKTLLEHGASVSKEDSEGETALSHVLLVSERLEDPPLVAESVRLLVGHGAKVRWWMVNKAMSAGPTTIYDALGLFKSRIQRPRG